MDSETSSKANYFLKLDISSDFFTLITLTLSEIFQSLLSDLTEDNMYLIIRTIEDVRQNIDLFEAFHKPFLIKELLKPLTEYYLIKARQFWNVKQNDLNLVT